MSNDKTMIFIKDVLKNMPADWINLTTHRLDIYNEQKAKTEFLEQFERLESTDVNGLEKKLENLPTAYDYIRLGHPLSCILEWSIAKAKKLKNESVISFSSQSMPIFAVLRSNLLANKKTRIIYNDKLPRNFNEKKIKEVYGYKFDLIKTSDELSDFDGSSIVVTDLNNLIDIEQNPKIDFIVAIEDFGSVTLVNEVTSSDYVSKIQHVRRRESIAMTPNDCLKMLKHFVGESKSDVVKVDNKNLLKKINEITNTSNIASIGSSGLSVQYAIMMGLIDSSMKSYPSKAIKFIVPPNCYGGTNDQARRVAACNQNVEILDLPVDGGEDMVHSIDKILNQVALDDAIAFIIAEIPTNPRVEVPHLNNLKNALSSVRKTKENKNAVAPVFILDQTFCPNVKFFGEGGFLDNVATISYVSGSKFPSGGLCTAGYCVANDKAKDLMTYVDAHLNLCDNQATDFQLSILDKQIPAMNQRIKDAYKNTREFVDYIQETLPTAKINFVSKDLADSGFTPSVFSLDLPSVGNTSQERESHKRDLNLKLINMMINEIPNESKFCVSYGQLKGCYWTIPATSTQGTTKEGDKDYIVRVSVSANLDLQKHQETFALFCSKYIQ